MRRNENVDLSKPTRASKAYIGIALFKFVIRFLRQIWPLLLLYFINPGQVTGIFLVLSVGVLSGISTLYAILTYYHFDFFIADDALNIRSGVIKRKEQSIPFGRIQNIHIEEQAIHRLFGVVRLKVETAGSKEEEGIIEALTPDLASQIKQRIDENHMMRSGVADAEDITEPEGQVISELSISDLFKIGITRNHLRTALILLGFAIGFLEDIRDLLPSDLTLSWESQMDKMFDYDPFMLTTLFGLFLIISMIITVGTTFFRFYRQRLTSFGDRWILTAGLIARREWVIPVKKIQEISFAVNPFQAWLNIGEIRIKTASSSEVGDEQLIRLSGVHENLFHSLTANFDVDAESAIEFKPVYAYRWRLWIFIGMIPALLFSFVSYFSILTRVATILIYLISTFFLTGALYRGYRMSEGEHHLCLRKGYGWRSVKWTLWPKMQAVQLTQGIYEQRKDYASIVLSHGAGTVSFPFMKKEEVLGVMNRGLERIERSQADWI